MVSYIFSVITKKLYWDKVYGFLSENNNDFEILFVIRKSNSELDDLLKIEKEKSNVSVFIFEDDISENNMINQAIKK